MAGNVLFQNQQSQQGPFRSTASAYGAESPHSGSDQLQFYSSNYNQYGTKPDASKLTLEDAQGGYRNSLQGARMSGRSTPLAGYTEQYRMEGRMGWLAAFGTTGYPDGDDYRF
jgi:hypothetical protein